MTRYVALVRAVNVGGTGALPSSDLKALGESCGLRDVRTYINSGNLLFTSDLTEAAVRDRLEAGLAAYLGRPTPVHVRSAEEMADAARQNPFPDARPASVMAHFIDEEPVRAMLEEARGVGGERLALGPRLIYVHYEAGVGRSRLKLPAASQGTARNMNSVARIAGLLAEME